MDGGLKLMASLAVNSIVHSQKILPSIPTYRSLAAPCPTMMRVAVANSNTIVAIEPSRIGWSLKLTNTCSVDRSGRDALARLTGMGTGA